MIKNFTKNFTEYILSIDQGTTSTRLALINKNLQIKNIKQKEHNQIHKELMAIKPFIFHATY